MEEYRRTASEAAVFVIHKKSVWFDICFSDDNFPGILFVKSFYA